MKATPINHVNAISLRTFELQNNKSRRLLPGPSNSCSNVNESQSLKQSTVDLVVKRMNKLGKTMKGKLSFGEKNLQSSRMEKVLMRVFGVVEGEKLLKASQCCLYTTTGPLEGILFASTERLAFCSDKPILQFSSPNGESLGFHYKVMIPVGKIRRVHQSENVKRPSQKYLVLPQDACSAALQAGIVAF